MQTFVPHGADFARNAQVLDRQRLGKQRVEAWQILNAMATGKGWANHPATRMWRSHPQALVRYGIAVCDEWVARGYQDSMRQRFVAMLTGDPVDMPPWLHDDDVVRSHRSNLVRKDPAHYGLLWPDVPPDLPYIWPV